MGREIVGERAFYLGPANGQVRRLRDRRIAAGFVAYQRLRRNAAAGVDEVTWAEYGERLDESLLDLRDRVHRGSYHPQPVRRVYIPKGDGKVRPLGVPALEDKIVQQAAQMILEPILEAEFIGLSYGFRPGRSQHDALDALAEAIRRKVNWVLDADIEAFFDTMRYPGRAVEGQATGGTESRGGAVSLTN